MNKLMILATVALFATVAFSFEVGTVTRAVDGDTLKVMINAEEETVRLIGVDTPESVHPTKPVEPGGIEASYYTKQLEGMKVLLTYDEKRRDFFGRLLAYVWIDTEGDLLCWNLHLIQEGYGDLYDKYSFGKEPWFKETLY